MYHIAAVSLSSLHFIAAYARAMSDLRRATAHFDSGQYAAALPFLQAALCRSEQQLGGASSAETARIVAVIGECHFALCCYRTAVTHYRRAAAIGNYSFVDCLRASCNAANALRNLKDYVEVENQINVSLSVIDTETVAATTAPSLL